MKNNKTLEILAVTYKHAEAKLPAFVYCLLSQTNMNFYCRIAHDGPSADGTKAFMESIISRYPENFDYFESETRMNVHGHQNRQKMLAEAISPILNLQNCDNLICNSYVEAILRAFEKFPTTQVLVWPIIHNYNNWGWFPGNEFRLCKTDMCQFAIKREIAQSVPFVPGMGYRNTQWDNKKDFCADGFWMDQLRSTHLALNIQTMAHCLGFHQ